MVAILNKTNSEQISITFKRPADSHTQTYTHTHVYTCTQVCYMLNSGYKEREEGREILNIRWETERESERERERER